MFPRRMHLTVWNKSHLHVIISRKLMQSLYIGCGFHAMARVQQWQKISENKMAQTKLIFNVVSLKAQKLFCIHNFLFFLFDIQEPWFKHVGIRYEINFCSKKHVPIQCLFSVAVSFFQRVWTALTFPTMKLEFWSVATIYIRSKIPA